MESQEIAVENQHVINVTMEESDWIDLMNGIEPAEPVCLTVKQREKAEADNRFAFTMFMEISKLEGANTFFSPISLNMAMGMLYNGSSGNTRAEMAKILDIANFSESELNEYYREISRNLLEIDPITDIVIANADLSVSHIKQKTFVEVDEEGTDAAAVTAMTIVGYGVMRSPNEPVRFFADRPFLFLIREKSTGVILFIGRIDEPFE